MPSSRRRISRSTYRVGLYLGDGFQQSFDERIGSIPNGSTLFVKGDDTGCFQLRKVSMDEDDLVLGLITAVWGVEFVCEHPNGGDVAGFLSEIGHDSPSSGVGEDAQERVFAGRLGGLLGFHGRSAGTGGVCSVYANPVATHWNGRQFAVRDASIARQSGRIQLAIRTL